MAPVSKRRKPKIESFDLQPGRMIGRHYEIVELLGSGWEGEVYKVRESTTRIERAASGPTPAAPIDEAAAPRSWSWRPGWSHGHASGYHRFSVQGEQCCSVCSG